jgi:hypothetical protein
VRSISKRQFRMLTSPGVVLADAAVYLTIVIIPVTSRYGYYVGTWRGNFYAAAAMQAVSFLGLYFLYYPPAHPLGLLFAQVFRELDYLGIFLFIAGSLPFLMGIVWASIYPSTDTHVFAPLVVGCVMLVLFAVWETYGKTKHPLTPTNIFTSSWGRDFTAPCIALAIINMFYYSSSIIWLTRWYGLETCGCTVSSTRPRSITRRHSAVNIRLQDSSLAMAADRRRDGHGYFRITPGIWNTSEHGNDDRISDALVDWIWLVHLSLHCDYPDGSCSRAVGHFRWAVGMCEICWRFK